jgi:hypothetical protein
MLSALQLPTAQPLPRSMPFYICPSKALFAAHIPAKAGTTTIKAWAAHQGEGDFNGTVVEARPAAGLQIRLKIRLASHEVVKVGREARMCTSSDDLRRRFRFALVRHPLRRAVSAYHDKVEVEQCNYPPFKWVCELPAAQRWPRFVEALYTNKFRDPHVAPLMEGISRMQLGPSPLHAVVKFEELDTWWPWILNCTRTRVPPAQRDLLHANAKPVEATAAPTDAYSAYFGDAGLLARLMHHYRDDMEAFGYAADDVADASVLARATVMLRNLRPRAPVNPARAPVLMLLAGAQARCFLARR